MNTTFSQNDRIECPWCAYTIKDLGDLGIGDGDYRVVECGVCGKSIHITARIDVSYTATEEEQ